MDRPNLPNSADDLGRVASFEQPASSPLAGHRTVVRRHTVGTRTRAVASMDSFTASRRRSIDQVLDTMMDSKQKEAIFDSPKLQNKCQRALSQSGGLMFVGNYRIGETIGKGRYSVVKIATHVLTNEFVALEIVSKAKLSKEDMRVLQREMQIMKLLDHPNIVRLYEVIDTPEYFYLVLEYVNGRTLSDKLPELFKLKKKKRMVTVRQIFTQLASAVAYCHREHVVHRDIKTDNLLIDETGNVKLADWGFSNLSNDLLNTHCGTPYYASPELFRPQAYNGPPSDVWAMGVLLYYMYVGKLPFRDDPIREYIKAGNYKLPKDLPSDLRSLIASMLRVDSQRRITAEEACMHPWVKGNEQSTATSNTDTSASRNALLKPHAPDSSESNDKNHNDAIELMIMHLGFNEDEIKQALASNSYDQVAATYYLLRDSPKLDMYRAYLLAPPAAQAPPAPAPTSDHNEPVVSLARRFSRAFGGGGSSSGGGGSTSGSANSSAPASPVSSPSRRRSANASRMINFLLSGIHHPKRRTASDDGNSVPSSPATARPPSEQHLHSPLGRVPTSASEDDVAQSTPTMDGQKSERRRSRLSALRSQYSQSSQTSQQ